MTEYITVVLTRNELEILDAAFEVLSGGDMVYAVLRAPHIVAAHQDLYLKFHEALEARRLDDSTI